MIRPSDYIWGLVDGFPAPLRQQRRLMILRSFVDDSDINQRPMSVLAGWIAPAHTWSRFADEWQLALEMRPMLRYFKMSEAMGLRGEFAGWSEDSRDFRLKYLVRLIEEYKLFAIGTAVHTDDYHSVFDGSPVKTFDIPYFLMFYGLMAGLVTAMAVPETERIDFVFDDQPGQIEKVLPAWAHFKEVAPERLRRFLGDPPIFRSDLTTLPLQAADLYAWFLRAKLTAEIGGGSYVSPWGNAGDGIETATWFWNRQNLQRARLGLDNATRLGVPVEIWNEE